MSGAAKIRVLRKRAKQCDGALRADLIASACDRFLRSRGIRTGQPENFNRWNTDELRDPE
jgi:hypothetical protein